MMGHSFTIPTLETERLTLRAPTMGDFDVYAAFRSGPRSAGVGGPYSRAQAFDHMCGLVGHWQLRGYGRWLVADKATDQALGVVGLFLPEDWPEPEIAWTMFDHAEGKGFAYEAALAARKYAYEVEGWSTAISLIMDDNSRSIALAARLGATHDGDFTHPSYGTMQIWRHPAPEELTT